VHLRIDRNSLFGGLNYDLSGQDEFDRRQVSLPVHEKLKDTDIEAIVTCIRNGW